MKAFTRILGALSLVCTLGASPQVVPYRTIVDEVQAKSYQFKPTVPVRVPTLIWGGDVAAYVGNGGERTTSNSTFAQHRLNVEFVHGDDFPSQVKEYLSGKSPFLRGEFNMIGAASEILSVSPDKKPVILLQLTWSAGDWAVANDAIKSLSDLAPKNGKKVRVALQLSGPHMGMLDIILSTAHLDWKDIEVVWCKDLTRVDGKPGDNPADVFRQGKADVAFMITPDMLGVGAQLPKDKQGAEETVVGAHVLVGTPTLTKGVGDFWAVENKFFREHHEWCEQFVAAYLKSVNDVVLWQKDYDATPKGSNANNYVKALSLAQKVYGESVLPTLEVEASGLVHDAVFVGIPGQVEFFLDKGNLNNFERKMAQTLDLATKLGFASTRAGFLAPDFDYRHVAKLAGVPYIEAPRAKQVVSAEDDDGSFLGVNGTKGLYTFSIGFEPNQKTFNVDTYGYEFGEVVKQISNFGGAVIAVRGHSDNNRVLKQLVQVGLQNGILRIQGTGKQRKFFVQTEEGWKELDFNQAARIANMIQQGKFDSANSNDPNVPNPRATMEAAITLSKERADAVKEAVLVYAKNKGLKINPEQIKTYGVGIAEPIKPKPAKPEDSRANMRVEFTLRAIPAESGSAEEYDLFGDSK